MAGLKGPFNSKVKTWIFHHSSHSNLPTNRRAHTLVHTEHRAAKYRPETDIQI